MIRLWAGRSGVRIPAEVRDLDLFQNVHTVCVGHEPSCLMDTGIAIPSNEPPVGWSWPRCICAASGAQVTNKWSSTSFPLYVFMTTLVFHLPLALYSTSIMWIFVEETGGQDSTEREIWELIYISYLNYCFLGHGTAYPFVDTDVSKEAATLSFLSSLNVVLNYPLTRQHGVNSQSRSMDLYSHRNLKSYWICDPCVITYICV